MIDIKDITKVFSNGDEQVRALDGVSLTVKENEFVAIMGSSGSGKSTLMNILGCLDTPTSGQYFLDGENVADFADETLSKIRNQKIGFIFQTFHLLPKLNAVQNVKLPLRYSEDETQNDEHVHYLLDRVGLSERKYHKPFEMSGGQRQRVAIARALVNKPSVILADEPTGNLDSKTSQEIMELLTELHKQGQTIIMVTHEDDIAEYAERVVTMKDGRICDEVIA